MNPARYLGRLLFPDSLRRWWRRSAGVDMGDLRSAAPTSRLFGGDRGHPIDRHYIERFLSDNADRVRGRVLEVGERTYTRRFGGQRVRTSDVLHAMPGNAEATIVGDLATGEGIPEAQFDAIILTQVLQCVFDLVPAVRTIRRALVPGGTALITVPAIGPVSRYDAERWGEYWHFTEQSVQRLLEPEFGAANVKVRGFGNHAVAHAFLAGMAAEELREEELAANDPDYPIVITAVASAPFPP